MSAVQLAPPPPVPAAPARAREVAQTLVVAIDAAPRVVAAVLAAADPAADARRALAGLGLHGARFAFAVRPGADDGTWLTITTRVTPGAGDAAWLVGPVLGAAMRRAARTVAARAQGDEG